MINYDSKKFESAKNELEKGVVGLRGKTADTNNARGIGENYEGKDLVDDVVAKLPNTTKNAEELLQNMGNTLGLMDKSSAFRGTPVVATTFLNRDGVMLPSHEYYSNYPNLTADYDIVAPIAGGSAQETNECLITAITMGDLVMMATYGLSNEDIVHTNYSFKNKEDALTYAASEIRAGRPVVLQVSGVGTGKIIEASPTPEATIDTSGKGTINKHFILSFGVNEKATTNINQTDMLYLDPAEGEIKQLGIGVDELDLQPRYLIRGEQCTEPLWSGGNYGYFVGTFNGEEPTNYSGGVEKLGEATQPSTKKVWVSFISNNTAYDGINYYRDVDGTYGEQYIEHDVPYDTANKGETICSAKNYPWI